MGNSKRFDIQFPIQERGLPNKVERILFSLLELHFSLSNQSQSYLNLAPYQRSQRLVSRLSKIYPHH